MQKTNFTSEIMSPFSGMLAYTKLRFLGILMSKLNLAKYAQCSEFISPFLECFTKQNCFFIVYFIAINSSLRPEQTDKTSLQLNNENICSFIFYYMLKIVTLKLENVRNICNTVIFMFL